MASKPRSTLSIRNRQKLCAVDAKLLRQIVTRFLKSIESIDGYELCLHLVDAPEMAKVNQQFLDHEGSTDVITFDHQEDPDSDRLYGELYLCLADTVKQSHQFRTTWQSELTRYAVHGILHLCGYDDLNDEDRKEMKRAENRCLRKLAAEFNLAALELEE
ncbi:MAG: rRNA maturation RNase YbeY [Limisphaerales bacterium]